MDYLTEFISELPAVAKPSLPYDIIPCRTRSIDLRRSGVYLLTGTRHQRDWVVVVAVVVVVGCL